MVNIKYAVLHGSIFVPNLVGNLGPTLTLEPNRISSMVLLGDGFLRLQVKDTEIMLPLTSVLHMVPASKPTLVPAQSSNGSSTEA
jgi:hypothetical protein